MNKLSLLLSQDHYSLAQHSTPLISADTYHTRTCPERRY